MTEYSCQLCDFSLYLPIAELSCSVLGLYDDARFPGRCLLALSDHHEEFSELNSSLTKEFVKDMQVAARAIKRAVQATRMNYAILGNAAAHLHAHIIPRQAKDDPIPRKSPWSHPNATSPLDETTKRQIIEAIGMEVSTG